MRIRLTRLDIGRIMRVMVAFGDPEQENIMAERIDKQTEARWTNVVQLIREAKTSLESARVALVIMERSGKALDRLDGVLGACNGLAYLCTPQRDRNHIAALPHIARS